METRNAIRISEKLKGTNWELFCYHLQRRDLPSFPIVCTRSFHCLLGNIEVQNNFATKLSISLNINTVQRCSHREIFDPNVLDTAILESSSVDYPSSYSIASNTVPKQQQLLSYVLKSFPRQQSTVCLSEIPDNVLVLSFRIIQNIILCIFGIFSSVGKNAIHHYQNPLPFG
jgi:hypothetical protein